MKKIQFFAAPVLCGALIALGGPACSDDGDPTDAGVDAADGSAVGDAASDVATPDARPPGLVGGQNDRVGRVAIAHALIRPESRVAWNQLDSVLPGSVSLSADSIQSQLQSHLVMWDMLDGVDNWEGGSPDGSLLTVPVDAGPDADGGTTKVFGYGHPLTQVLRNDFLVVDTGKPFSTTSYLDVELQALAGAPGSHLSCGGRWMNEDAVDKMASFLVKRAATGVSDGVDAPSKPANITFPYLVAP